MGLYELEHTRCSSLALPSPPLPSLPAALALAGALYGLPVTYVHPTYLDATATSTYNATHSVLSVTVAVRRGRRGRRRGTPLQRLAQPRRHQ